MRYWLISLALALFVVAVGDSQETKKKPKEPDKDVKDTEPKFPTEYLGKGFEQWRKDISYKNNKDPYKRETAIKAVLVFGPTRAYDAVPDIIAELKRHLPTDPVDLSIRVNGIMALSTIFKYKKEPDSKHIDQALDLYKKALADGQIILRVRAVQGLPYLGPKSRTLIKEVIKVAKDPATWEIRKEGIQTLTVLSINDKGGPDEDGWFTVVKAMDDSAALVRMTALQGLAAMSHGMTNTQKNQTLKKLETVITRTNEDTSIVIWSHVGVMTIRQAVSKDHLDPLISYTRHSDANVRSQAIQAIGTCGDKAKAAYPALLEAMQHDKDPGVANTAALAIGAIQAPEALAPMIKILSDKKVDVPLRVRTLQAVGSYGTKGKAAVPSVMGLIDDPDLNVAVTAITATIALHAYEAIPVLKKMAADKRLNDVLRQAAEDAIDNFGELEKMEREKKEKDKKTPEKK